MVLGDIGKSMSRLAFNRLGRDASKSVQPKNAVDHKYVLDWKWFSNR
jgi:hypothetical protein